MQCTAFVVPLSWGRCPDSVGNFKGQERTLFDWGRVHAGGRMVKDHNPQPLLPILRQAQSKPGKGSLLPSRPGMARVRSFA